MSIDPRVDIGHVHLKVSDIDRALGFYEGVLGFEVMARMGDEAAFISAGGYHHHIGLNTWESKGAGPPPRNTTGSTTPQSAIRTARRSPRRCDESSTPASRHRRQRPRRQRGDLPARSGRQRRRALPRPAEGRVAAHGGRRLHHVHAAARPASAARRARLKTYQRERRPRRLVYTVRAGATFMPSRAN